MTRFLPLFRRALALGLFMSAGVMTAPALAAEQSEAEIMAEIEAQLAAEMAAMDAEAAAKQAAARAAGAMPTQAAQAAQASEAKPQAPPVPAQVYETVAIILDTSMGPITIALETERAPITARYFLRLVDEKRLDGTDIYRAFTFPERPDIGMIQGGPQNDRKRVIEPVKHEPTSQTGLTHGDGAVSMARGALDSANGDFFIIIGEMYGLDAGSGQNGPDDQGFAVFGQVTDGMALVRSIATAPRSPTKGEGAMKGQMLDPPISIRSARRAPSEPEG